MWEDTLFGTSKCLGCSSISIISSSSSKTEFNNNNNNNRIRARRVGVFVCILVLCFLAIVLSHTTLVNVFTSICDTSTCQSQARRKSTSRPRKNASTIAPSLRFLSTSCWPFSSRLAHRPF